MHLPSGYIPNIYVFFFFVEPHQQHMEVPGLGVESELHLLAYVTATATLEHSHIRH